MIKIIPNVFSYNFTLDFNGKRTGDNRIDSHCANILTFLTFEAS